MNGPICIYFGEAPFWIGSEWTTELKKKSTLARTLCLENPADLELHFAIEQLDEGKLNAVLLIDTGADAFWEKFKQYFTCLEAGGGLVQNEKGEFLFIKRRGLWDLPKGKLDEGETIEACALREVKEETGLQMVELVNPLCNTYHVYHEKGKFMLKKSVWFRMIADSSQSLTPQTEEQIEAIEWLAPSETGKVFAHTFPSIKDVLFASDAFQIHS